MPAPRQIATSDVVGTIADRLARYDVRVSDSKAALLASITSVPGDVGTILVNGYTTAGDSGGVTAYARLSAVPSHGEYIQIGDAIFGIVIEGGLADIRKFSAKDTLSNGPSFSNFDSTSAVQRAADYFAWLDPSGANGGCVFYPPGVYKHGQIRIPRATKFTTAGRRQTTVLDVRTVRDTPTFDVTVEAVEFDGFQANALADGAPFIRVPSGITCVIDNFWLDNPGSSYMIETAGNTRINNLRCFPKPGTPQVAANAFVRQTGGSLTINDPQMDGSANSMALVRCEAATRLSIRNARVAGIPLVDIVPGNGQTVLDVTVSSVSSSSAPRSVVNVAPTSGGSVRKVSVAQPDLVNTSGSAVFVGGAGTIDTVELVGGLARGSSAHNVQIDKCSDFKSSMSVHGSSSGSGYYIGAGVGRFDIHAKCGSKGTVGGNARYGVEIASGVGGNFSLRGDFIGNTLGPMLDASTGTNKSIDILNDDGSRSIILPPNVNYVVSSPSGTPNVEVQGSKPGVVLADTGSGAIKARLYALSNLFWLAVDRAGDGLFSEIVAKFRSVSGSVNYPSISPATAGNPVVYSVEGTDTNASIRLVGKGTGPVQSGSPFKPPSVSFSNLSSTYPPATYVGCSVRVTDRSYRSVVSDGSNWRFEDGSVAT